MRSGRLLVLTLARCTGAELAVRRGRAQAPKNNWARCLNAGSDHPARPREPLRARCAPPSC
eukprot:9266443-Pyramimonas_sp.AAC.1